MNGQRRTLPRSAKILGAALLSTLLATLVACGGGGSDTTTSAGTGGSSGSNSGSPSSSPSSSLATGTYLVSWQPVNDPEVTGYKVYYSTTPFGSGTVSTVTVGSTPSYTFKPGSAGIAAGSTVYVAVAAISATMESALSDQATIVVQ